LSLAFQPPFNPRTIRGTRFRYRPGRQRRPNEINTGRFAYTSITVYCRIRSEVYNKTYFTVFFIDTFVSLAIPSLQLRLITSLFSNLDSKLKTNSQYLSIDHCRVLVLICSNILLRSCLAQIPLALCSAFSSDHYAH
jgi:hypothetical protein